MRNRLSTSVVDAAHKRAASPLLVALAIFLAMVFAFRVADLWGYLPDVGEVDSVQP